MRCRAAARSNTSSQVVVQTAHRPFRPTSASASPSGVGRARLKRCLTFCTVCSIRASVPEPRPARVPMQPMAACRSATLHYRDWHAAHRFAGGGRGPACPGRPPAVSNRQGALPHRVPLATCLLLHYYPPAGEPLFGPAQRRTPRLRRLHVSASCSCCSCCRFLRRPSAQS